MPQKFYHITELIILNLVSAYAIVFTNLSLEKVTFETIISAVVALSVIIYNMARAIHYFKKDSKRNEKD